MLNRLFRTGVLVGVGRYAWRNRERLMSTGRQVANRRRGRRY